MSDESRDNPNDELPAPPETPVGEGAGEDFVGAGPAGGDEVDGEPVPKRRKRRRGPKPVIRVGALNITSFLDMSFALLTFLILGASFSMSEGVTSGKLPQGGEGSAVQLPEAPKVPVVLNVRTEGPDMYRVDFEGLRAIPPTGDFAALTESMRDLRFDQQTNPTGTYEPDHPIIIQPRGDVTWQGVMQAFNAARRARFSNIVIARATD